MSGLLVLLACLAIAFAMALPTVVRASGTPSKPPTTARVAAETVPLYLKASGTIALNFSKIPYEDIYQKVKLSPAACRSLVVVARSGFDASGPIVAKTNAMPGKEPGTCVYSLKVPADQNSTIAIQPFSWGAENLSANQYLKLSRQDRLWYKKTASGQYFKHELRGESSSFKFDYKHNRGGAEFNLPVYMKLAPGQ